MSQHRIEMIMRNMRDLFNRYENLLDEERRLANAQQLLLEIAEAKIEIRADVTEAVQRYNAATGQTLTLQQAKNLFHPQQPAIPTP